ncbi:MAG: AMP-binding protein, partial [Clostridia bacterium]|nr:AMP-binding protein [Clostridia bacterium]
MITEKIRQNALRYPERIAYSCDGRSITCDRLWSDACGYAEHLKRITCSPVIICANKSPETITAVTACLIAGLPYIPADPSITLPRLEDIITVSGAEIMISETKLPVSAYCCSLEELGSCEKKADGVYDGDTAYIIFTSGSTGVPKGVPVSKDSLENFVSWLSSLSPLDGYRDITVMNQASFAFDLSVADLY